jgi:hypothetical protein
MGLTLHCGAHEVEFEDVLAVPTPEPVDTHYPIPHELLFNETRDVLTSHGLQVQDEKHALWSNGLRYFSVLELKSDRSDYATVVGLRNSHDKSFAAAIACGSRVFVCDNLAFSGEIVIGRKHTRYITDDLHRLTNDAIGRLGNLKIAHEKRVDAYHATELEDEHVDHLIMEGYRSKVIPTSKIGKVWQAWEKPEHEEFEERTVWSLYNAFTAQFGGLQTIKGGTILSGILDPLCDFDAVEVMKEAA